MRYTFTDILALPITSNQLTSSWQA